MIPPDSGTTEFYLPESYMHIGEDGEFAAARTLNECANITGLRTTAVAVNADVGRRDSHVVSVLYAISCSTTANPTNARFYNLAAVLDDHGDQFHLGHGHREMLAEAAGCLHLKYYQNTIDAFFSAKFVLFF